MTCPHCDSFKISCTTNLGTRCACVNSLSSGRGGFRMVVVVAINVIETFVFHLFLDFFVTNQKRT